MIRRLGLAHAVSPSRPNNHAAVRLAWLATGVLLLGGCADQGQPFTPTDPDVTAYALVRSDWPSPENPGVPAYARIEPFAPHVYSDGTTAFIVFYRDPACVPAGFNLLDFFGAPAVFACTLRVEGSSLWEGGVSSNPPKQSMTRGTDVPVWIAPAAAIQAAVADGMLTIGELREVEGLVEGTAERYHEMLQPGGGGQTLWKLVLTAFGTLDDGRTFSVHLTSLGGEVKAIRVDLR